ncbi:hypothetical protein PR202_ga31198 [Eleusine coracana subsp. coracana]|uniref:Protein transport protein Sec24-like CEF n=1 Tax=Eleusine coracana subsp. coracana TaxID=191504 RepID=A0AAV5DRB5_ELECO|nr:hypothetical protein PR202_ga31198 [Eleusine coracana subsp. coracana]
MRMPYMPGSMPPNALGHGMSPASTPKMPYSPHSQVSTPSKIDPTQIPRPIAERSVIIFETRQGGQAAIPPAASSEFIVKDTGNCSPRLMRCTMNQIPCTGDLLTTSGMPLALLVQPFSLPHPSEEPIQVRDPMPAVYFFLIDVSMNALNTGSTAAACSAIFQALSDLPEGPQTMVGIATFDSAIHFYSLKRAQQQARLEAKEEAANRAAVLAQPVMVVPAAKEKKVECAAVLVHTVVVVPEAAATPSSSLFLAAPSVPIRRKKTKKKPLMLIVPDIQDVYTPFQTDLILPILECRENLEQLLESIPNMFGNNRVADSAFGAAMKAAFLAIKSTGGKLLVFQSGRSNISMADKEAHKLLQPVDKNLKTMALEFAEYQVCVDVFLTTQSYVDIASISVVPNTTGGRVYYYYPFSALSDPAKLFNDLRWNISRPQGFEAVMRVRCSQGLQVQDYLGSFCKRVPTDVDLPAIDSDKAIMVTFKHNDKFQENSECSFQVIMLYMEAIFFHQVSSLVIFSSQLGGLAWEFRQRVLASGFVGGKVRDQVTSTCINILQSYRKYCASVSSSGQLILPEALKLLPLYALALTKSIGLRNDGRLDDRSYWASIVSSISVVLAVPLVFPRMIALHDLILREDDESLVPTPLTLNSENIRDDGVYFMENGEDGLLYVGNSVHPAILEQLFGVSSLAAVPNQLVLEQFDNELSRKVNEVVNEIRRQRCSYLRLRLCKKGDPSGDFLRSLLVEDKAPGSLSYVEFLVHVHRQIQSKLT